MAAAITGSGAAGSENERRASPYGSGEHLLLRSPRLLRFRLEWLFTVEDLLNVRDAPSALSSSLSQSRHRPRQHTMLCDHAPWCLRLKVGSVCSLALVLSVYLFSSIIKNTQNQTATRQKDHKGPRMPKRFQFSISFVKIRGKKRFY